ncbi:hypothetical protein BMS3Abin14_01700 [bacterium BMS3Abin14]|nr:hypothetical protein BMS3Abin14_01700 [bacterium BMS3Abin14]
MRGFCLPGTDKGFVDLVELLQAEAMAKIHEHWRVERCFIAEFVEPEKVLQIRVLTNLLHRFFITNTKALFDDQGTESNTGRLGRSTLTALRKLFFVERLGGIPRDHTRQDNPAVIASELATERKVEVFKSQLIIGCCSIHL